MIFLQTCHVFKAHTATEKAGAEKQTLEFATFDSATYVMKDDGTVCKSILIWA